MGLRVPRDGPGDLVHERAAAPVVRAGGGGANSAALQISDGLSNVVLLAVGGAAFAALGGGAVGAAHGETAAGGSHPAAFAAVFLPMAVVALVGAWVATRVRAERR